MSIGRERGVSGARGKEECEWGEKVSGVREECVGVARERERSVSWAREWGCDWGERVGVLVGRERERGEWGEREEYE